MVQAGIHRLPPAEAGRAIIRPVWHLQHQGHTPVSLVTRHIWVMLSSVPLFLFVKGAVVSREKLFNCRAGRKEGVFRELAPDT